MRADLVLSMETGQFYHTPQVAPGRQNDQRIDFIGSDSTQIGNGSFDPLRALMPAIEELRRELILPLFVAPYPG